MQKLIFSETGITTNNQQNNTELCLTGSEKLLHDHGPLLQAEHFKLLYILMPLGMFREIQMH